MSLKDKIFNALEISQDKKAINLFVDVFLITLISLNVLFVIIESVQPIREKFFEFFQYFELFSVIIFTIEYILRVWSITSDPRYKHPIKGRIKYIFSFLALIDLFAILPFYLTFFSADLRIIRILRLFRLFRILKAARYISAIQIITRVFEEKKEQLAITIIFTFFLLILVSSIMYYIENPIQPDKFSSIPETMWWGVATLTTVGYGDVYPVTALGKILGGIIAILGVGLFALPAGILAAGFSEIISQKDKLSNN